MYIIRKQSQTLALYGDNNHQTLYLYWVKAHSLNGENICKSISFKSQISLNAYPLRGQTIISLVGSIFVKAHTFSLYVMWTKMVEKQYTDDAHITIYGIGECPLDF